MTADRPVQDLREPVPGRTDRAGLGLPGPTILSMCDRLLGEVGRRHHMFAWLRAPGAGAGEWLAVDAYYPRSRLIVMCRPQPTPHESIYRELIPAHGLGLLTLDPPVLGNDRDGVEATLAAKIFDLEHLPRRRASRRPKPAEPAAEPARAAAKPAEPARAAAKPTRASTKPAQPALPPPEPAPLAAAKPRAQEPAAPPWTPVKVAHTSIPRGWVQGLGVIAGLAFAIVLIVEVYLGVIKVAIGDGRLVLGLAIVIDAFSRALGTAAAERARRRGLAFACAIGGSPVVAWCTLGRTSSRVQVEPAPLAGLLALAAGALALLGLLIGS